MENLLHLIFFLPIVIIWVMVGYQLLLTIAGYSHYCRAQWEHEDILFNTPELPPLTILIPAHNEEKVIERTVMTMLALDYPADRLSLLVIDDASTDATADILDRMAANNPQVRVLHRVAPEGGRGKAAALNDAIRYVDSEFVAVYDADNRPEPDALKLLVAQFVRHPEIGAAVGKFRTGNRRRNLLTRFINIEGLGVQGITQAGRWKILGISFLSGTNYVIRRSLIAEMNGWDEEALAEDSELSVRIYQHGGRIAYVPYSVSWEQEPETFAVWIRQRTRWARGNNYTLFKMLRSLFRTRPRLVILDILYTLLMPYCLLFAIVASQLSFILSLFGLKLIAVSGQFWLYAIALYCLETLLVLSYDSEDTLENFGVTLIMYFTYCQIWPLALVRAFYADVIKREKRIWDKTVRFDSEIMPDEPATVATPRLGEERNAERVL